ncbi:MAG TPA: GatB/YqeY domain-containing protein [Candidatus Dojkabacteria bacterium]|nr:GatB/YqeY domain-containing protein [Candidatus Dojkabacteria bacterium]
MSLIETLRKDMFSASKEGNTEKADILKMAMASIKNAQLASEEELSDADMEKILRKEVKKVQDSIAQFTQMGRNDLAEREKHQLEVLEQYLPKQMSEEDVEKVVKAKVEELKPEGMRDMGKVMGAVMKEIGGNADGNVVREMVQKHLQ